MSTGPGRFRRLRRRRRVPVGGSGRGPDFPPDAGPPDAGVREPRRPRPDSGSAAAAEAEPSEQRLDLTSQPS
ncbi:MAG TPA: hypothetical protein VIL34_22680 [Actinopolymorphaceae bacterium]